MTQIISRECPLLLGSQSPRRRDIVGGLGIPFVVHAAEIDESVHPAEPVDDYLVRVVDAKLSAVAPAAVVRRAAGALVADTVVVIDDQIVGKPRDSEDALRLLELLAGRVHRVLTRFAVLDCDRPGEVASARTVESLVTMRAASRDELTRYAATGEGLDKAGAYAVQGCGAFLVERIEGSHTNVIGLPACEVVLELRRVGLVQGFPLNREVPR
jgi:septum formation protein